MIREKLHSRRGLTLVELMATILCAAVIMFGASAAILSAFRTQHVTNDSTRMQQTERIVHAGLQSLSGEVRGCTKNADGSEWTLYGRNGVKLLRCTGGVLYVGETAIWSGIDTELTITDQLISVRFEQNEHSYENVVYCRMLEADFVPPMEGGGGNEPEQEMRPVVPPSQQSARNAYLATLAGQYGSTGQIKDSGVYYSEWYVGGSYLMNPAWNEETPWCACFLSWALAQQPEGSLTEAPRFATVDDGVAWFRERDAWLAPEGSPLPGDLVFFDWDADESADHVGAVLTADGDSLVTVEGNSNGRVESRSYPTDSPLILGYGTLPWK